MGKSSSTSQSTKVDPLQKEAVTDIYGRAKAVADTPYTAYTGQTVAGLTPDTQTAYGMTRQLATGDTGAAALQGSIQGTQAAMNYQPQSVVSNIGQYMSPYTQSVIDAAMGDIERNRLIQNQAIAGQARAAGAFGGSRHGVVEAEGNRAAQELAAKTAAGLRESGYTQALGAAQQDLANRQAAANLGLSAAGQLGTLSGTEIQQALQKAAALETIGASQQQQGQAELTDAYNRWLEAQKYPQTQTSWLASLYSGLPTLGGTTTQTNNPSAMSQIGQGISNVAGLSFLLG
jgi:hypothetical protein